MYLQREDYAREGIYSFSHFLVIVLIISLALFSFKKQVFGILIGLVPLTNIPANSSGTALLFQGTVSLLFFSVLLQNVQWKKSASFKMRVAWFLIAYLVVSGLVTTINLWDPTKDWLKVIFITLIKTAVPIACIAIVAEKSNLIKIDQVSFKNGAKYQAATILVLISSIFYQYLAGYNEPLGPYCYNSMFFQTRLTLGFCSPNELGLWCAGVFPYIIRWAKQKTFIMKLTVWLLFLMVCFYSGSRGVIISLAIVLLAILVFKKNISFPILILGSALAVTVVLSSSLRNEGLLSIDSRQEDFASVIQLFLEKPEKMIFGCGFGISGYDHPQPHNMILDILYNIGIIGCALYVFFICDLLYRLHRSGATAFFSVIGVLAFGVGHACWTSWLFYYFILLAFIDSRFEKNLPSKTKLVPCYV